MSKGISSQVRIAHFALSMFILAAAASPAAMTDAELTSRVATTASSPIRASTTSNHRGVVVFYIDPSGKAVARVDRLKPMSEGMRAILAMYALEDSAGCDELDKSGQLHCVLTDSLGLGEQCSEEQLGLVGAWFKNGIPDMAGYGAGSFTKAIKEGTLGELCTRTPDTSGIQMIWAIIRVRQDGDRVYVNAMRDSHRYSDGPDYEVTYETEYLIKANNVAVIDQKQSPVKTSY
jgi:hypothetical protein